MTTPFFSAPTMVEFLLCLGRTTKWCGQNSKHNFVSTWMLCFPHCAVSSIRSNRELINTAGSWIPPSLLLSPWGEVKSKDMLCSQAVQMIPAHMNAWKRWVMALAKLWQEGAGCHHREAGFWGSQEDAGRRWPLSWVFKDDYLFTQREWRGEHFRQKEDSRSSHRVRKE